MPRSERIADRYELRAPIGRGAMGEVWESVDLRLKRTVALKFIHPDFLESDDEWQRAVRRFRREAAALAGVDHPNVAAVHDAGEWKTLQYLVMQLVPGTATLADLVAEHGPLTVEDASASGAQIAAGLSAVHEAGIVHRDLKPQNVMVAPDGTLKIIDFGLVAMTGTASTRLTAAGESIGAPDYRAPEQAGGQHSLVDHRADLYSLGCLLHFMLTTRPPFCAPTAALVALAHGSQSPARLGALRHDVAPDLEDLVLRLLAKLPDDRPGDAASVYADLAPHLPSSAPNALRASVSGLGMDVTWPFRFPASPRPTATIADGILGQR
ncbi:serine/threonine protein kinase [Streptomyces sp. PKU-MA01144]|uniref:serine/threonine-protein kinase n=1 Tax=Streptomyces sp. PKU-MA01144 TaxID=2729138 RepID=UPI00147BAA49|nr:serine/threonine-protein kinase [Streptomyces sp. PKU-MA01144]NNJ03498.1 serine/threonine protein kinase [Streptomyces sp. PKU-MA01144]